MTTEKPFNSQNKIIALLCFFLLDFIGTEPVDVRLLLRFLAGIILVATGRKCAIHREIKSRQKKLHANADLCEKYFKIEQSIETGLIDWWTIDKLNAPNESTTSGNYENDIPWKTKFIRYEHREIRIQTGRRIEHNIKNIGYNFCWIIERKNNLILKSSWDLKLHVIV